MRKRVLVQEEMSSGNFMPFAKNEYMIASRTTVDSYSSHSYKPECRLQGACDASQHKWRAHQPAATTLIVQKFSTAEKD